MSTKLDKLKAYRYVYIILMCFCFFWTYVFIDRGRLTKENYKSISGIVITTGHDCLIGIRKTKTYCYYFKLDNYNQTLAIMTDENYKPILDDNFKGLSVGDTITVGLISDFMRDNFSVNLSVDKIERNNKVLYNNIHDSIWNRQMKIGLGALLIGLIFIVLIIISNKKIKNAS